MNYNNWFFDQYKYLKGKRKGVETYNDTKWVNLYNRYKTLTSMESQLFAEQPFGIVGNNYGFEQLLELMGRSNYTFEDLNKSLINTYNVSLKNAMGKMLVNTQSVMFHAKNTDMRVVSSDKSGKYYIVDAPFNQLHFGDRDEFIRQRLHNMHTTENNYYVPIDKFMSPEVSDILGFTIMCTVNGYFCNDCYVAMDDKGFKFKVKWGYSSDVDFIVYKLDDSFVYTLTDVDYKDITMAESIGSSAFNDLIKKKGLGISYRCIINIHDPVFDKSLATVPNFGLLTRGGLSLLGLQDATKQMIEKNKSEKLSVTIYALKYFHEVPNVYPAMNYYDMIDSKKAYDDKYEKIKDVHNNQVVVTSTYVKNKLEMCTPPISLDRSSTSSFNIIDNCFNIENRLAPVKGLLLDVGKALNKTPITSYDVSSGIINKLSRALPILKASYKYYQQAAILTALIPFDRVNEFAELVDNCQKTLNKAVQLLNQPDADYNQISAYGVKEFYGENFTTFVSKISAPLKDDKLDTLYSVRNVTKNFFTNDNTGRFNRPVSEQCFITLRYHRDVESWLFDYPTIKHFHGISNTFYIDSDIEGDEVYKFFVLYTDTDSPAELVVDPLKQETIFDFDLFVQEVTKHMGYMRYWAAENKLLKLCKIIYGKYDEDTCIQVLSRILKRKTKADDILHIYPSDIEYEQSAVQSFNITAGEDDEYAPFAINYLFYTLGMLYGNEDRLQAYFINSLASDKFNNRYSDIDITRLLIDEPRSDVNFSRFAHTPTTPQLDISSIDPTSTYGLYYGISGIFGANGTPLETGAYPYVFNIYGGDRRNWYINDRILQNDYYFAFNSDITSHGYVEYNYGVDIRLGKIFTRYLTAVYSYISELQTNYAKTFNLKSVCDTACETYTEFRHEIMEYLQDNPNLMIQTSRTIAELIVAGEFYTEMSALSNLYYMLIRINFHGQNTNIFKAANDFIADLRSVFYLYGFDNYALKPIRALYIHFKKINKTMNMYEFRQWVYGIDYNTIVQLPKMLAKNENSDVTAEKFENWAGLFSAFVRNCGSIIPMIEERVSALRTSFYAQHMTPIINHCINLINNYCFDFYTINEITANLDTLYEVEPYAVIVNVNENDNHFHIPGTEPTSATHKLIFFTKTDYVNGKYKISSLRNICDYTMFAGETITGLTATVVNSTGNSLGTLTCSMSFSRVGSSADKSADMSELISITDHPIDFQNVHETFDVNGDNMIVNEKRTPMNYEMFVGNHFIPLDSTLEWVTSGPNDLPGPVDRLYISNQKLNSFAVINYGDNDKPCVYFKPSQIIHLPIDSIGNITSVGGKYAEGQRIYLYTKDTGFVFPATITKIDWSEAHGFVEAVVDSYNAKWFKITDPQLIETYFTQDIECEVIDDNISNFFDEYNNPSYESYNIIKAPNPFDPSDPDFDTRYSMPGDPIYVVNNAPFVYTRLNYFFNKLVPNRFIDAEGETHKMYRIRYIGENNLTDEKKISINMVSHDFNPMSEPELFPVLRSEPNDHEVWDKEIRVFEIYKNGGTVEGTTKPIYIPGAIYLRDQYYAAAQEALEEMSKLGPGHWYDYYLRLYQMYNYKYEYYSEFVKRLDYMEAEQEKPSTWYNVRSFDAAAVYMTNGRAKATFIPNVSYLTFTDKVDVFIYDWEHKMWLDSNSYTMTLTKVDGARFHESDAYGTEAVQYKLDITFDSTVETSRRLLIYFGYHKSDIFEDIQINDKTCLVRFKPIMSTSKERIGYDMYSDIRIRKHFDGHETYKFEVPSSDIDIVGGFHFRRPHRTGKYMFSPAIRMCDLTVTQDNHTYDFSHFSLYIKNPFPTTTTSRSFKRPSYTVTINQPIDSFVADQNIKLICISNGDDRAYDGNISTVMFEAFTAGSPSSQGLTITNSSLDYITAGKYICTVFASSEYKSIGGVITVTVSSVEENVIEGNGEWIRVPNEFASYKQLPDEFVIKPSDIVLPTTSAVVFDFKNEYIKYSEDEIDQKNANTFNPFEYYYDSENDIKLPVSDVRRNSIEDRLVVDTTEHPEVKVIKTSYIGICRYSLHYIPEDGFIDVTGYIPTPLSRSRYEFYVNGRNINNPENLHILSPTTFQLTNLRSLKNFELIELVDDTYRSNVFREGPVYVSLNGEICSSFRRVMLSNVDMVKEDIKFVFNADQRDTLQDYTNDLINPPHNVDIEPDVLEGIYGEDTSDDDYNKLYNIPTINGVQLMHLSMHDIGFVEIPEDKILDEFDKTWKREILTNPHFKKTHQIDNKTQYVALHSKNTSEAFPNVEDPENWICLYITGNMGRYFSLYISTAEDGKIDEVTKTLKIIPFVKAGMYILIPKSFAGKYLHATYDNSNVIQL